MAVLFAFGVIAPLVAVIGYVPAMVLLILVVLYGIYHMIINYIANSIIQRL